MLVLLEHWRTATAVTLPAEIGAAGLSAPLDGLMKDPFVRIAPGCQPGADPEVVRMTVAEALAKLDADRAARREIEEGEEDIFGPATEALTWRLSQAAQARSKATRGEAEDRTEWEIAANGLRLNRSERGAFESALRSAGLAPLPLDRGDGQEK